VSLFQAAFHGALGAGDLGSFSLSLLLENREQNDSLR
jgi:hypothetical protein